MTTIHPSTLLRRALVADASVSGGTGLLLLMLAGPLSQVLGVPAAILGWAGFAFLPYAAIIAWLATRPSLSRLAVMSVIAGNLAWVTASVIFAFSGWVNPTMLGYTFILLQAAVVAGFAEMQWMGLNRTAAAAVGGAI